MKNATRGRATVIPAGRAITPTLDETCSQLEDLYQGIMSGAVPLDKARVGLGVKKTQMKRFDLLIASARMNPMARPAVSSLLGLPEPQEKSSGATAA